jgi:pimeloyl-ACP methyl ester carboxylesterase
VRQLARNVLDWSALASIRAPTLVMAGAEDLLMPAPLMRVYASHVPHSETSVLCAAGHSAYWEQPVDFNSAVLGFISRHRHRV